MKKHLKLNQFQEIQTPLSM